jgi:hypothetical protein
MSINVQCPGCGKRYKVDDRFAGKKAKCQSCGGAIAVPAAAPTKVAASDDPFAAMDELERTGTAAPETAYPAAPPAPPRGAAPPPRRAGTVYNPALAQPSVSTSRSSGASQGVKVGLSVGVGLLCFALGFWAVHALTGGATHRASVASQGSRPAAGSSSNSGNSDEHGLEATGASDISEGLSGNRTARAPAPQNSAVSAAPPAPAAADVEAKPPVVFKPFAGPDPKLLDKLAEDTWLPSVPYVFKLAKDYGGQGSFVSNQDDPSIISYQTVYVWVGPPRKQSGPAPMFMVESQPRHNKKFPRVLTQATDATKYSVTPKDPMDTQLLFEGGKVEFGTLDGIESVRAVGKDTVGQNALIYVMLDDRWFMRVVIANVIPGTPDFELLDAMMRTFHHKDPKADAPASR